MGPAATINSADANIKLNGIPVAPQSFGVSARRIYIATAATYFLHATISDNTTTVYTMTADTMGATAPTDNGVPPKYSQVITHRDRLWMNDPANPNLVWYSNLGEPYTVASTNFIAIGDNTFDLVRGFAVYGESLMVFCDRSAWIIYMPSTTETDWKLLRTKSPYGTNSPFSFVPYQNKVMFAAMDQSDKFVGFAALAGDALAPSTTFMTVSSAGSDMQSDKIETDMFLVPGNMMNLISGYTWKNRIFYALCYGAGITANNRVYYYDFSPSNLKKQQQGAWVPFTGWNAAMFTEYGGSLYYGSSSANGKVYKCMVDGVYADEGSAINSYFWTKEFPGLPGDENQHKDFRRLDLYYGKLGDWYMDLGYRTDGDKGDGDRVQIDCNPGGSLWGAMVFGRDPWGGGDEDDIINQPLGIARGKRIQFKFSNQSVAGQAFRVSGYTFSYNRKGAR
jgi:hypothetical protein